VVAGESEICYIDGYAGVLSYRGYNIDVYKRQALDTMATVQWAASVRDFLLSETAVGRRNWMDDVIVHEGPLVAEGYIAVPRKPGLGVELNPDVVKANLAEGEKYWD